MFRLEMRGVVPQKDEAIKMSAKISITPGPFVGDRKYELVISRARQKQLADKIFDWLDSLPVEIERHIDVVSFAPAGKNHVGQEHIMIRVIMSGNNEDSDGKWKHEISEEFLCPSDSDSHVLHYGDDVFKNLQNKILWGLEKKIKTFKSTYAHLEELVKLIPYT